MATIIVTKAEHKKRGRNLAETAGIQAEIS